ncbi:hypothetical protein Bca4012_019054 [Brassica carinata]
MEGVMSSMDLAREALKRKRKLETSVDSPPPACTEHQETDPVKGGKGYNVYGSMNRTYDDVGVFNVPLTPTTILMGKAGLHSYNSHEGRSLQFKSVTRARARFPPMNYYVTMEAIDPHSSSPVTIEACVCHASSNNANLTLITTSCCIQGSKEDSSSWDEDGVDLLYRGVMPKWLDDGTEKHLKYYEVKESELQENEWLHIYAHVAAYSEWSNRVVDYFPLKIEKVMVQTMEHVEPNVNTFKSSSGIFYISFKTCGGLNCRGIIRQTMDGRPQHVCLEAVCEIDK